MKTTSNRLAQSSSLISRLDKLVTVSPGSNLSLNITMLYEDDETREWAREAFDRVSNLAGEQPVRPTWWRLSNLGQPGVLAAAASTAMRADVIAVAVHTAEGLPLPFYAWANSWSPNRLQPSGVLVALLGAPKINGKMSGRVGDYLRTIARQSRLHILVEQRSFSAHSTLPANGHSRNGHASHFAERF